MYGLHNHTLYSHDGFSSVFETCESAIKKGMKGIAFTDHVDLILFEERKVYDNALGLIKDVAIAKEKYKGKTIGIVAHRAPQLAFEVITKDISWEDANKNDWRKTGDWNPGWEYELK